MSTTTTDNTAALATHLDDQVEKVVMIDGKEVSVNVANTHSQARRVPKVTFRYSKILPKYKLGPTHYAKIFLPKTYEDAKKAALKCFGRLLIHSNFSAKEGQPIAHFELKVSIKKSDQPQGFMWAHILADEWWEIMNELIEENPELEVSVIPYKD